MNKPGLGLVLGLAMVGVIAVPGEVRADKRRIVLMDIDGARTDSLQKDIAKLIKTEHFVVPEQAYMRVAGRRGATKLNPSNIRKVCRDLGCDGIVDGVIEAEDGGYVFVIRLREAATGRITKRVAMRLKKPKLSAEIERGLKSRLLAAIDDIEAIGGGSRKSRDREFEDEDVSDVPSGGGDEFGDEAFGDESVAEPARRVKKKERAPREDRELIATPRAQRESGGDGFEDTGFDRTGAADGDDEVPQNLSSGRASDSGNFSLSDDDGGGSDPSLTAAVEPDSGPEDPREFPVSVVAGVSVQKRDLRFTFSPMLEGTQRPVPYKGSPAPGVYVRGELYPVAFSKNASSALKNFGFGFTLDRVLGLKVESQTNGMKVSGTAVQQRAEAEVRYRYNFGSKPSYPSLTGSVGYGQLQFALAKQLNFDVPNVAYQYVNPGLTLRIPIGTSLAVEAAGRFMAVLGAGDIQLEAQYGSAVTTGVDGDLFIETKFFKNFLARAGAHVTFVGFDFQSATAGKADRNQDGTQDVGGAADMYLGGYVTLGYQY